MLRRGFLAAFAVASVTLLGCDDPSGADVAAEVGRYELRTVNGTAVPAHFPVAGGILTFTAGSVELRSGAAFTASFTTTLSTGAPPAQTGTYARAGSYTRSGERMTLNYSDSPAESATLAGSTLTLTSDGRIFVFRK